MDIMVALRQPRKLHTEAEWQAFGNGLERIDQAFLGIVAAAANLIAAEGEVSADGEMVCLPIARVRALEEAVARMKLTPAV